MKFMILLGIFLNLSWVHAGINVDWSCPQNASSKKTELSFDDAGRIKFGPDVFSQKINGLTQSQANECFSNFKTKASEEVTAFQAAQCPSSKDPFCYISKSYFSEKLNVALKDSKLGKEFYKEEVSRIPSTPQRYLEEMIQKKKIDPKKLSQAFSYKGQDYKVSDFDEVVGDNIENVFQELSRDDAKQYAQNYMVAKSQLLNTKETSAGRTAALNNLNRMFGYIYGDKGAEELAKILECRPEDSLTPIATVIKKIEETEEVSRCAALKPGEHKVFKKESNNYYSTGNYILKRKEDGNYQAILNVNFEASSGSVTPAEMLDRSKKCLALAAPHMKGPDGKTIEMTILTPTEVSKLPSDERPGRYNIKIEGPSYGTNAGAYAQGVGCDTITHEMLHLLGLCDEYQENRPEYAQYGWTCRVVTKAPSIMRDLSVFDKAVGKTNQCNCQGQPCSSIMNSSNEDIKKLYTSETYYDAVDYRFRNSFCKEEYASAATTITEPSKAAIVTSSDAKSFTLESRFVSTLTSAPHYRILKTKVTCTCPTGDQNCLNQKTQAVTRIQNLSTKPSCPTNAPFISNTRRELASSGTKLSGGVLTLVSSPAIPSLLQPNHFNKILEGNCPGKAKGYQECAEFAYKDKPCNVPQKCMDDKYYLGSEQ